MSTDVFANFFELAIASDDLGDVVCQKVIPGIRKPQVSINDFLNSLPYHLTYLFRGRKRLHICMHTSCISSLFGFICADLKMCMRSFQICLTAGNQYIIRRYLLSHKTIKIIINYLLLRQIS